MQLSIYTLVIVAQCIHTSPTGNTKDLFTFQEDENLPPDLSSPGTAINTPPASSTIFSTNPLQVAQDWNPILIPGLGLTNDGGVDLPHDSEPELPLPRHPDSSPPSKPQVVESSPPDSQHQEPRLAPNAPHKLSGLECKVNDVPPPILIRV